MILLYIFVYNNRKEVYYEMNRKERLINQIFRLLTIIETSANQSIINQIRGLLNALRD